MITFLWALFGSAPLACLLFLARQRQQESKRFKRSPVFLRVCLVNTQPGKQRTDTQIAISMTDEGPSPFRADLQSGKVINFLAGFHASVQAVQKIPKTLRTLPQATVFSHTGGSGHRRLFWYRI